MLAGFNVEGNRLILPKFNEGIIYREAFQRTLS